MTSNEPPGPSDPQQEPGHLPPPPPLGPPAGSGSGFGPPEQPPIYGSGPVPPLPPVGPPTGFNDPFGYSATEAIGYGWHKLKQNAVFWPVATFVLFAALIAVDTAVSAILPGTSPVFDTDWDAEPEAFTFVTFGADMTSSIASSLVSFVLMAFFVRGALLETQGQKASFENIFRGIDYGQVLLVSILVNVGTVIGLVLCIIPGIIFAFLSTFALYFVVDQQQSAVDAIKSSFALVRGRIGDSLLTIILVFLVSLLGLLACCIGIIWAYPVGIMAMAYAYRRFLGHPVA